jgi:putative redox protein
VKHVTVTWQPDADSFVAHGAHADRTITMNAPHGAGPSTGISPSENLLAAVGGCTAWDVVEILRKQRQPVRGVEVRVDADHAEVPPYPYTRIVVTYLVTGRGVDPAAVERAVRLSIEKYCSVIATVRGVATIETAVDVIEDSPSGDAAEAVAAEATASRRAPA